MVRRKRTKSWQQVLKHDVEVALATQLDREHGEQIDRWRREIERLGFGSLPIAREVVRAGKTLDRLSLRRKGRLQFWMPWG